MDETRIEDIIERRTAREIWIGWALTVGIVVTLTTLCVCTGFALTAVKP